MSDNRHCCFIDWDSDPIDGVPCEQKAGFEIWSEDDEFTDSCADHVEDLKTIGETNCVWRIGEGWVS